MSRPSAECASLGEAAAFDVFSNGVYEASNTTVPGRVAAAGNVTVSAINMGASASGETYDLISGGNVTASNGTLDGGIRYAGTLNQAADFNITGTKSHGDPPFSFDNQFTDLAQLSSSLAQLDTNGTSVVLQPWGALQFSAGTATGPLYVFNVPGDLLAQALGSEINLPAGSTAVINVTGPNVQATKEDYMNLSGGITPRQILWNFDGVSTLTVGGNVAWQGTILAPRTDVTNTTSHNLHGQVIAANARLGSWAITEAPFSGCLPAPAAAPLQLDALCMDASGNIALRLRNTGAHDIPDVTWQDLDSAQGGSFTAFAGHDRYFAVNAADGQPHRIRVTSGPTTLDVTAHPTECHARITVHQQVIGPSPGGTWTNVLSDSSGPIHSQALADGESFTVDVVGGFVDGSVPIGEIPGGTVYEVTQPDPRGGTAVVSQYPITVTEGDDVYVVVTTVYSEDPVLPPGIVDPEQPTLPPGTPDPPGGPDLIGGGGPAADLEVTHSIRPRRFPVGATVTTTTLVRNRGQLAASGAVLRELPQYPRLRASRVARILSVTTTAGRCSGVRPLRCTLGTVRPGQRITVRTKARVLVTGQLRSVVFVSSRTRESNTTNNEAIVGLTSTNRAPLVGVRVRAPIRGSVGQSFTYRVTATLRRSVGARGVRVCTPIPASFTNRRALGTFAYRGMRCRDFRGMRKGSTRTLVVQAVPAAGGTVRLRGRATVVGSSRIARDSSRAHISVVACPAVLTRC